VNTPARVNPNRIQTVIVSQFKFTLQAIAHYLSSRDDIVVTHVATSAADCIESAVGNTADVILLDLQMTDNDDLAQAAVVDLLRARPRSKLVVLAMSEEDPRLLPALIAGACGYVTRSQDLKMVVRALNSAARHHVVASPALALRLLRHMRDSEVPPASAYNLTPRELEVLKFVARGATNAQIASELGISGSTVKNHLCSVFAKLDVSSRSQAIAFAVKRGLIAI
jgi:DNA-binding NarL/FixJ family response regulator